MKKKTLAALLAALLALMLVLSACANSDDASKGDEKSETKTEEKTDAKTDEASAEPENAPHKIYREQHWYSEEQTLMEIDYFDDEGHMVKYEFYSRTGELTRAADLRVTDACAEIDTADMEALPDAAAVEVREIFAADSADGPFETTQSFYVLAYNALGEIVGMQCVDMTEGEPIMFFTTVYSTDAQGNETGFERTVGEGELYMERVDENTFTDGVLTGKTSTITTYGIAAYEDGKFFLDPYSEPQTEIHTCEFVY